MTAYIYSKVAVYAELGGALRLARNARSFVTDTVTGLPVDVTQGARVAPYLDTDAHGIADFTAEHPGPLRLTTGTVFTDNYSNELPGLALDAVTSSAASAVSASASADAAALSASLVGAPADTAVAAIVTDAASLTRAAGNGVWARQREHNVLDYGAVADDTGSGAGTDNRSAFQAALDAAAPGKGVVIVPAAPLRYRIAMQTAITGADGSFPGYGVTVPAGVRLEFEPGAIIVPTGATGGSSMKPVILLDRAHGASVIGATVRGLMTSFATRDNGGGVSVYRTFDAEITDLDIDGTQNSLSVKGALTAAATDTTQDLRLTNIRVGPLCGAGPHLFGAHHRTVLRGLVVEGTTIYDALQLEAPPGYTDASQDFSGSDIDIRSCAARGLFINPSNVGVTLRNVKVRNPGRLATGAIVGYDQNAPANATSNSCVTIFGSGADITNLDIGGGLTVNPTLQPAVSWTCAGYGLYLNGVSRVTIRGLTHSGNDGGTIGLANTAGRVVYADHRVKIIDPATQPTVVYAAVSVPPLSIERTAVARFQAMSLLPGWNLTGPDGASVAPYAPSNVVSTVVTDKVFGTGSLRVTETTNAFARLDINLPDAQIVKGGVAHLLMVAKFAAPAENFSWLYGGLVSSRQLFPATQAARDYQAGAWRYIHSVIPIATTDTITNTMSLYWNYGGVVSGLDITVNALWLYVSPDPFAAAPTFDPTPEMRSTAVPTVGTWARGRRVANGAPAASGTLGWVCVADGTPGTWKTYGPITA